VTGELVRNSRCPLCGGRMKRGVATIPFILSNYDPTMTEAYDHQIRDILKMPEHRIELARPIAGVDVGKFKSSVDELIRQIRLHESKQ